VVLQPISFTVQGGSAARQAASPCHEAVLHVKDIQSATPLSQLAPNVYAELNEVVFDGMLPAELELRWSGRLRSSAGRCIFKRQKDVHRAEIELATSVLHTPERLRATLAHEMCHAAQWLVNRTSRPPHGPSFKFWARKLEQRMPDIKVSLRHSYLAKEKYRHRCSVCGVAIVGERGIQRCGHCGGALRLEKLLPCRPKAPPFGEFVRAEYAKLRKRWPKVTHQRIMQELSRRWRSKKRKPKKKLKLKGQAKGRACVPDKRHDKGIALTYADLVLLDLLIN